MMSNVGKELTEIIEEGYEKRYDKENPRYCMYFRDENNEQYRINVYDLKKGKVISDYTLDKRLPTIVDDSDRKARERIRGL
jgi:hypothetical protein